MLPLCENSLLGGCIECLGVGKTTPLAQLAYPKLKPKNDQTPLARHCLLLPESHSCRSIIYKTLSIHLILQLFRPIENGLVWSRQLGNELTILSTSLNNSIASGHHKLVLCYFYFIFFDVTLKDIIGTPISPWKSLNYEVPSSGDCGEHNRRCRKT